MRFPTPARTALGHGCTIDGDVVSRCGRAVGTVKAVDDTFLASPARGLTPAGAFASIKDALTHLVHADCLQMIHELTSLNPVDWNPNGRSA